MRAAVRLALCNVASSVFGHCHGCLLPRELTAAEVVALTCFRHLMQSHFDGCRTLH